VSTYPSGGGCSLGAINGGNLENNGGFLGETGRDWKIMEDSAGGFCWRIMEES